MHHEIKCMACTERGICATTTRSHGKPSRTKHNQGLTFSEQVELRDSRTHACAVYPRCSVTQRVAQDRV
jgi:hypothetical protein